MLIDLLVSILKHLVLSNINIFPLIIIKHPCQAAMFVFPMATCHKFTLKQMQLSASQETLNSDKSRASTGFNGWDRLASTLYHKYDAK